MILTLGDCFRLKYLHMLEVAGEAVLTYTLRCGIQGKCPSVSLDHYLDNLPPTSTANYKKMTHKGQKKYFTSTDQTQLQKDPSCGSFDITLLHKAILIACEHVADVKDPKWTTASDHLEYLVTKVKTLRNEVIHEKPTIHSDLQFQVKIDELKTMVVRILEAARDRYGRCHQEFVQERDKVVGAVLHLSRESIGKEEILQRSANKMLPLFITETNRQLHDSLSHTRYLDPLHFLSGRQDNKVDVHTVFSRIEVVLNTNTTAPADSGGHEVDYLKLLLLTQLGGGGYGTCHAARGKPHLLLIEGDAGTGKTTLLTFLLTEWLQEERQRRMEGLHHYDLLVWVVCREHTSPSLDDLLHHMLPEAKVKYGSLLLPFFKQSRVLFLIDGLDERHDSSRRLVADIMNEGRDAHHFTLLCTSRPEEVIDFKATVPRNYAITHVRIVGISPEERMSVVAKHYEWLTGGTAWKHSPLPHCLEEVLWMDLFRLPLNLLFLATMLFYKPDDFNVKIIQSQLYHFINTWSVDKLQDRLATHASLSARKHRQKKIDTVLKVAHQIALQGLLQSRIYLTSEDEDLLHDSCSREGLPRSEFMQAFYVLRRDVFLGQATERYCSPHKGMQENFAAHHILACLTHHHHSPGDIMRLLMDAVPGHNLHVGPLKNMLCHLLGLLAHEDFASAMSEAVALIAESGVMTTNQWLAVMANTDTNIHILQRVAQHVAQHMIQQVAQRVRLHVAQRVVQYVAQHIWKRNHTTRDDTDELRVTDSTALAATTLLPLIPKRKVQITLGREPAAMDELVKALECHTVEELWLTHQSTHPHTAATSHSRHLLRRIPRDQLEYFRGYLEPDDLGLLPAGLQHLFVLLGGDEHTRTFLPALSTALTSFTHLHTLSISVEATAVFPDVVTPLPSTTANVRLILSGVDDDHMEEAWRIAANLSPAKEGFWELEFPGAKLDMGGWLRLVTGLAQAGVKVAYALNVLHTTMSLDQEQQLYAHIRSLLGCHLRSSVTFPSMLGMKRSVFREPVSVSKIFISFFALLVFILQYFVW